MEYVCVLTRVCVQCGFVIWSDDEQSSKKYIMGGKYISHNSVSLHLSNLR